MGFIKGLQAVLLRRSPSSPRPRVPLGIAKPKGWSTVIGPAVFAAIAVALLVYDHVHSRVTAVVFWFTLALVATIFVWLVSKTAAAVAREHSSALTDELTGLASREKLDLDLADALAPDASEDCVLVLVELDGLQTYNDSHGHVAGDELLHGFASALADVAGGLGSTAYRIEGSGFAVLGRTASCPAGAIVTAVSAVSPHGDDEHVIETSHGDVRLPEEAGDPRLAIETAAQRRRARKQRQRRSARGQLRQVLLEVVATRRPELGNEAPDLADWIIAVGHELDLRQELDDIVLAAELRDIGLLTVPDAIIGKGTALSERERELIHQHPIAGQRILDAAPTLAAAAALVRGVNENFDGSGYPDAVAGPAIPLGSRLIAVCVAFAAMTSPAPQRPGIDAGEALAELDRRAGTEFDPRVVHALANVIKETQPAIGAHPRPERTQPPTSPPSQARAVPA
ncbi:MAG: diguanylate cyclase and metal dependent phosphohydrolase [Solirubrobacterales bacterium]|nr:diguanylate cyclase and metal dependent phosphohydrolase [Solirubrobacterales bacterium]